MQDNWKFDLRKNTAKELKQEHLDESEKFKNWNLRARKRRKTVVKWTYRTMLALAVLLPLLALWVWVAG